MIDRASYVPPFAIGEVMQGGSAGEVVASERANQKGRRSCRVYGRLAWQFY